MTEAEIDRIETALEISLPRVYRNLMVPFPLRSCRGNSDTELWDDSDRLIEENKQLRFGLFGGVKPWPKQYFCLGGAGSGCVYALLLEGDDPEVWWIDHRHLDAETTQATGMRFSEWSEKYLLELQSDLEGEGIAPDGSPRDRQTIAAKNAYVSGLSLLTFFVIVVSLIYAASLLR